MAVLSFFYFCEKLLEFTNELGVIFNIIILNKRIRCLNPSQHQSQPKIPTILLSSSSVFLHPCNRHHHYCGCRHHCLVACRSGAQFLPEHLPGPCSLPIIACWKPCLPHKFGSKCTHPSKLPPVFPSLLQPLHQGNVCTLCDYTLPKWMDNERPLRLSQSLACNQ